jgi:hypothetical protein
MSRLTENNNMEASDFEDDEFDPDYEYNEEDSSMVNILTSVLSRAIYTYSSIFYSFSFHRT